MLNFPALLPTPSNVGIKVESPQRFPMKNCLRGTHSLLLTALHLIFFSVPVQYGIKKKEEKEAEAAAAMEQASEGSLTRPKKAVPTGCGVKRKSLQ